MAKVLLQYRSTPHSITQTAPAVSLNNRKLTTMRDRLNPMFSSYKNRSKGEKNIPDVGSSVLALNLREGPKWYNATILEQLAINLYNVHVHELNTVWKRHANQLSNIPEPTAHEHNKCKCRSGPAPTDSSVVNAPSALSDRPRSQRKNSLLTD